MSFRPTAKRLLTDCFRDLRATGLVDPDVTLERDLVLRGEDSPLDSIAFLSLMSGLEGRLQQYLGPDIELTWDRVEAHGCIDLETLLDAVVELSAGTYA